MYARLSLDVMYEQVAGVVQHTLVLVVEPEVRAHLDLARLLLILLVLLVVHRLHLVEQALAPDLPDVVLLEQHALVVERLVLLPPHLVETLLHVPPLLVLGLEPPHDQRHSHHRVPPQAVDDVGALVSVDPPDGPLVDARAGAAQAVVQPVPRHLLRRHPRHLLLDALQDLDGVAVRLENDVELESLVLRSENI